jgi:acyl-CoA thioesterase-2
MNRVLQDLVDLLDLDNLEVNLFRGESRDLGGKSVFGGQVIGQALVAAGRTIEDAVPHSLHAYFLRPGDMAKPIVYDVDRVRDGRTFSARRVQAIQHGNPILTMIASFQRPEAGLSHQVEAPEVPHPDTLRPMADLQREWLAAMPEVPERIRQAVNSQSLAIEFRPVTPWNPLQPEKREPRQHIWLRAAGKLPDDPMLHTCVLAYASDFNLLSTALLPHGRGWLDRSMVVASIDHAIWFHRPFRADEWLLYSMDSPTSQASRGLSRGLVYDLQGRIVASVVQESLMRDVSGG